MKKVSPEKIRTADFPIKELREDILREAKILKIHSGFAELIVERVVFQVNDFLSKHKIVTKEEVEKIVIKELKKYNKDLAYIYHNRDKII